MLTRRGFIGRVASAFSLAVAGVMRAPGAIAASVASGLHRIGGMVIRRGDANYELWRGSMVWYIFKPDRRPDVMIRAKSEQDAIGAVTYAREEGLKVATRATGHNPARGCLRQGGVLLDLSQLRDVEVDAEAGTAWIGPGIRSEDLVELLGEHGWCFPAAHTGIVGMGGYVIGGGMGWNMQEWDVACRSIIGAEVVTADGQKVITSATENPELLWAIRGAGPGFFGAVLRYKLKLFPAPQAIIKSKYLIPIDKLDAAFAALWEITAAKQKQLELLAVIGRFAPPFDAPPEQRDLVLAVSAIAFAKSREHGAKLLEPVARSAIPGLSMLKQENAPLTFPELYAGQETDHASPNRTAVHNIWTDKPDEALSVLAELMQETPPRSPRSFLLSAWGINPDRDDDDSCWSYQADHYVSWYQMAEKAEHIEPNFAWMDKSVELVRPFTRGYYLNEVNPMRYPEVLEGTFGAAKWKRLGELRRKYDPAGVFHGYLGQS
jgi:FAD/FMN-containing dehydrogenase